MRVAELFRSRQGEGLLTGTESAMVRTSGCNLRCWYCDTPYASWNPEGEDLSIEEIVGRITHMDRKHVVITGGEPLLLAEMIPLTEALRERGHHITIETAGTLYLPVQCDLMSISPKTSNSTPPVDQDPRWSERHERTRHVPECIRRFVAEYTYQFKFVIDRMQDCHEVEDYLAEFPQIDRSRVMLMPQGTNAETLEEKTEWLRPHCEKSGLLFCPRRQVEWYGMTRGT